MRLGTKVSDARYGTLKFSSSTGSQILSIINNGTMLNTENINVSDGNKTVYVWTTKMMHCLFVSMATR